ncbi:MAG: serine protease [Actinobacteria bacterium]|nr:serine protease [Actinomycetota bacterium]
MKLVKFAVGALLCAPMALVPAALSAPSAASAPTWAPAATAAIHPGVQMFTNGSQCTANFIYTDASGTYIGQAAHCSGTGGNTATNGCTSGTLPVGTPVEVTGATKPGVMVYNSWATMQSLHEADANTCQYNDLALVKLDPVDVLNTNPSVPSWGGPVGLNTTGLSFGDSIYSYGNSELRFGITALSPKSGVSTGDDGDGWSHGTNFTNPGVPGDSGSGLLDSNGNATGILSTLGISSSGSTNNWGDLSRELNYLHTHTSFTGVQLVPGTQPFSAGGGGGLGALLSTSGLLGGLRGLFG